MCVLRAVLREVVNIILKPKQWMCGELARDVGTTCFPGAGLLGWTSNLQRDAGKPGTSWILLLRFSEAGWTYPLLPFLKGSLVTGVAKG